MSEGIYPDFIRQPALNNTRDVGLAGEVHAGDLLYIPCGSAHQVENVDITVAVRLTHLDSNTMFCTRDMVNSGWRGLSPDWTQNYLQMLLDTVRKTPDPVEDVTLPEFCRPSNIEGSRAGAEEEDDRRDD